MAVTLTAPVEGKQPGDEYTGPNEAFLLAEGYASQEGYDGPGIANTGPASLEDLEAHPQFNENDDDPVLAITSATPAFGTNDGVVLGKASEQPVFATDEDVAKVDEPSPNAEGDKPEDEPTVAEKPTRKTAKKS